MRREEEGEKGADLNRPGRIDGMLSYLHGLDEADVFGGEGVEGGQSSLQCRESLRQVPLTLIFDGLGLCSCLIGHCLICSHYLEVCIWKDITRDTVCSLLHVGMYTSSFSPLNFPFFSSSLLSPTPLSLFHPLPPSP